MKVVTAQQGSLDGAVDRFGRCQYLLLLIPILLLGRLSQSGSKRDRWCRIAVAQYLARKR